MDNCIKIVIWGDNRRFYGRKLRFMGPQALHRKTKFPTIKWQNAPQNIIFFTHQTMRYKQ